MDGIILKREAQLIFNGEPIFYKKSDMDQAKKYIEKKIKKYKYEFLFSFEEKIIPENIIESNQKNIEIAEYRMANKEDILAFISNLKTFLKNRDFKFIKENILNNFY